MQTEIVSFNCSTSTGNQDITAPGLGSVVPKAVLFCGVGSDVFDDNDTHAKMGWGAADGTRQWAMGGNAADGQGTTQTGVSSSSSLCLLFTSDAGSSPSIDGSASFVSFIAGGVRINWGDSLSDDYKCLAIFFAGDDVSVRADTFVLGAQDVEVDITAPGFRPKLIFGTTSGGGLTTESPCRLSIGAAVDNGSGYDQRSWVYQDYDDVGTTRVRGQVYNNRIGGRGDNTYDVEFTTPDANGFSSYTRRDSPTSDSFHYLAIDCDNDVKVFGYTTPLATGNQATTGIGFQPEAVLIAGTYQTAENTDQEAHMSHLFGGFISGSEEWSWSINSENASGTSDCNSIPTERAFDMMAPTGTSQIITATFVSMDSDGFTLNFSLIGGSVLPRYGWGVAFGPVPATTEQFMMVS